MDAAARGAPADTNGPDSDPALTRTVGRRTFLRVLGSTAPGAAAAACAPVPAEKLIPYVVPPDDAVPGVATWYATVCGECPAGCGMQVRTREGRAVKVEGNPEHPLNRGSLCARGQASLQGLYDPDRYTGPLQRRITNAAAGQSVLEPIDWAEAQRLFVAGLRAARPGGVAVVTPLLSGALDRLVERWAAAVGARRIRYEPFAHEALRAAGLAAFGRRAVPRCDFAGPDLIVSFGADFLETWLSPVEHGRAFADGRRRGGDRRTRLVQLEPRLSLTGAQADEWLAIEPGTEGLLAAAMVHVILAERRALLPQADAAAADGIFALVRDHAPGAVAGRAGVDAETIRTLARRFADPEAGGGRTLAVGGGVSAAGADATAALTAIHLLNHVAGNTGVTLAFDPQDAAGEAGAAGRGGAGTHRDMLELAAAMEAGEVDLLLLHGVNPVHAMPGGARFAAAMQRVPAVVSSASCPDETSSLADLVLPAHTPLEAWGDAEPRPGVRGLQQPAMRPLHDTRHLGDLLLDSARALGGAAAEALPAEGDFAALLREEWRQAYARERAAAGDPEPAAADFEAHWSGALRRGGAWRAAAPEAVTLNPAVLDAPLDLDPAAGGGRALALVVYPTVNLYDGRGANRAWLQEVPDPLLQTAWSSWIEAAPETARAIGAEEGQLVAVESDHGKVDAALLLNPRLRPGVVAMPLGQGHTHYGRYASGVGVNAAALLDPEPEQAGGGPRWLGTRVDVPPRDVRRPLPRLQTTFEQHGREIARAVTPEALATGAAEPDEPAFSLYPEIVHPVHRWGMAIDLDACTGCNACVAACYAENNVPVLGADRMRRGRTMSWIRIERFVEDEDGPGAGNRFLPMLCQHCDHAPCESVCPTYATYHTDEGLNAQVYNRCVGTRYCANNCPYKVRRFNWFQPEVPDPLHLQLNPDVTARTAGVMEKCTFCVQRIREGQDRARDADRPPRDGDITPACAQTCPAQAIVFGDLNDPGSRVSRAAADPRAYHVLGELNTRPAVTYLKKVRDA